MRVLVCGGRGYSDMGRVTDVMYGLRPSVVIHGAVRGADSLAGLWARTSGVPVAEFPADWETYGRAAGHIRNAHMKRRARAAGVEVREVS